MNVVTPSGSRQKRATITSPTKFVLCGQKRRAVASIKGLIVSATIAGKEVYKKSFAAEFLAKSHYDNLAEIPLPADLSEEDEDLQPQAAVG